MASIIIDLDDTIVDSRQLAELRRLKKWKECVTSLSVTSCEQEVISGLALARERGLSIAVVTSSVSFYANAVIRHHKIPYDTLVAYHDTARHKPHPEPILKAIKKLNATGRVIGIGDSHLDCSAYKSAGLKSFGAGWSPVLDREAGWDYVLETATELRALVHAMTAQRAGQ